MSKFIVLIGPPGAGKGTQAKLVSEKLDLPHISSGDIFREYFNNQSELGKIAHRYIERGELVPDEITIAMIRERLSKSDCETGAILDGFPRNPVQADALEQMLLEMDSEVDLVAYIDVPQEELIERLTGRLTCREQGHVFHRKYNPPKVANRCDYDGSELYQRDDDKEETVKRRINVYMQQTMPLIEYYLRKNLLVKVDGMQTIEQVTKTLLEVIGNKR